MYFLVYVCSKETQFLLQQLGGKTIRYKIYIAKLL